MALVVGTNCGLVTSAPTEDPSGSGTYTMDNYGRCVKITTTEAITITEVGWWCDSATEEANFEVGLYSDNANVPGTLLQVERTNAKGTSAGWKKKTGLSWSLDASTVYWLSVQCDNTTTTTYIDYQSIGGERYSYNSSLATLPDTWTATGTSDNYMMTIYGVYSTGETPTGTADKDTIWVNNNGTWVEFPYFDYFKIDKKQNQMSEFEITAFDISTAQKEYFCEQAEVLFFCGTSMVLKGRIQTIEWKSAYEIVAKGYGMEVKLSDKQYISEGEDRIQYDNTSAKTIITEINSDILTTASSGIFQTDFGNISMRYEYANRLNALGKTCEAIDYYWWVSQTDSDNYDADYLNVASSQGETTSQKTFDLTSNSTLIAQERDTSNLINYVKGLGYGDGVNQLSTYQYVASTQSSFLSANIEATNTSISCSSIPFNATGSVRIAKEIVEYVGTSSTALTGCTRGIGSTAKAHNKNCYIEQYYSTSSAQSGSSIDTYGIMDYTLINKSIINEETLEVVASGYLSDHKEPIQTIKIESDEPLTDATLNIGDLITVTSSEANVDGSYHIVAQEFEDNYGVLNMKTQVSNRSLEFIEQMKKSKEEAENMSKYMQGATNIYAIAETENLDNDHPLDLTFYVPNEAIAINSVKLNFKQKGWRSYGDYFITEEELQDPNTIVSIGEYGYEMYIRVSNSGYPTSVTTSTLTDTNSTWTTNSYQNFVVRCEDQNRMINSNSSNILYLRTAWDTIPETSSQYIIIEPYTTDQTDLDITDIIDSIGRGKWANIRFENVGGQESYDAPDSSLDGDLWNYTNSGTSGRVTSSTITETDNYIEGAFYINTGSTTASFNVGISSSDLPSLVDMAEVNFRIQRGAQVPTDDSDGALIFTTDSKSYGNLSEGVDYEVLDDWLYLKVDREFNFSSINIGEGTTLAPFFPDDEGAALFIKCTGSATIAGEVYNDFRNGINSTGSGVRGNSVVTTWNGITTPGVANGGSGGRGDDSYGAQGSGGFQGNGYGGAGGGGGAYDASSGLKGYGGAGGNGGSSPGGGGGGVAGPGDDTDNGDPGSQSKGGGGGAVTENTSVELAYGGAGGGIGSNGQNASIPNPGESGEDICCGGGGGGGGLVGYSGIHFYLYADSITFSGTVQTSGYQGGAGGNGGNGENDGSTHGGGGGGGAGGGGGNAGNIRMFYISSFDDSGSTKTQAGGSGGSGGSGGTSDGSGAVGSSGNSGTAGSAGTFQAVQQTSGFQESDAKMYVFGETYNILDDDSEWRLLKQPNDDWILYDDLVAYDTFSAANNVIGVQMNGNYTNSSAINYNWKLYDITIGGRARMRIEGNVYVQTFLQSE